MLSFAAMTTLFRVRARRTHRTWPAIAALVLLAVVSPFAALCFGDGHAGVEAMLAPHHVASGAGQVGAPGSRGEATSHGPCIDALIESAIRDRSGCLPSLDAGAHAVVAVLGDSDADASGFVADRWTRIAQVEPIAPSARSLRSTVLRI